MRKCIGLFFSLFILCLFTSSVEAASFNLTPSTKQVAPGSTFTVRVGGEAIGRVNLSVSNGTLSSSSVWVEENYINVTVTAGESGVVVVTATPVTGFSDSDANLYNPGPRSVSVSIVSNSSSTNPNPKPDAKPSMGASTTTPKKSSNNDLVALKVKEGDISPNFQSSCTEYSLTLPSNTQEINIEGNPKEEKSKVEGLGKRNVKPGNNDIEIVVTAENGSKKTYMIHIYVEEEPVVFFPYQEKQIGVVRNLKGILVPEGFTKETITINDNEITLFTKENLTLLYGQHEETKNFYLFDKENQEIKNLCMPLQINNQMYYVLDNALYESVTTLEKITIGNVEVECNTYKQDNNYCVLNAIKEDGTIVEYLYEKSESTLELFPKFLNTCPPLEKEKPLVWIVISSVLFGLLGIVTFMLMKEKRGSHHEKI